MKFTQDSGPAGYIIRAYAPGRVTVAYPPESPAAPHERPAFQEEFLSASFIISPKQLLRDWAPQSFEALLEEHLQPLLALDPEVVLLGTGAKIRFPRSAWLTAFHQRGIGMEVMDLGAVCRTYNILMTEGRNVAAAIMTR